MNVFQKTLLIITILYEFIFSSNDIVSDINYLISNRIELGLIDNLFVDPNKNIKTRINYFHSLILFDNNEFHGVSSDLIYTWFIFGLMFTGALEPPNYKYVALINGGYSFKIANDFWFEVNNSFHPMLFVTNSGIIINSKLGFSYGEKIKVKIGIFQNVDLTKKKDYKLGLNLGIGL